MTPFDPKLHSKLLLTEAGLRKCVEIGLSESDHLDFKVQRERQSPEFKTVVRVAAAALASSGKGYLIIGVDESRDRRSVATAVPGVPNAEARMLAQQIEDALGSRLDPPIKERRAIIVQIGDERAVVVVLLRGRPNYPVSVEDDNGGVTSYVRERAANVPLKPHDARLRRRELDARRIGMPLALVCAVLVTGVVTLGWKYSRLTARRTLGAEEKLAIANSLRARPIGKITIAHPAADIEAKLYARDFGEAFNSQGWVVERAEMLGVDGRGVILLGGVSDPRSDGGCLIPFASSLYAAARALESAHVGTLQCEITHSVDRPMLFIGRNPESPQVEWLTESQPNQTPTTRAPLPRPPSE